MGSGLLVTVAAVVLATFAFIGISVIVYEWVRGKIGPPSE
jgi:hypothetical protein